MNKTCYSRIADSILDLKLRAFGAVHIVGPKWCGKTTTAGQKAKSGRKLKTNTRFLVLCHKGKTTS
ncbi:MAG: hypothetical protein K2M08_07015 [Anaeroplasmataceae bacterium]|nr:hypothetical protein [Anaeroplasmataceae bacterium]MDE6242152.1 hypothetical protein [Anaeroplasmataceae bacterium]